MNTSKPNPKIVHAGLKTLLNKQPNWDAFKPGSSEHQDWLGRAYALIKRWDINRAESMWISVGFISSPGTLRNSGVTDILNLIHQAVNDIEIDLPEEPQQVFGPGAVYDFYRELKGLFKTAQKNLLVVDPYLDTEIFDGYFSEPLLGIEIKMLTNKNAADLNIALEKYNLQNKTSVEIRKSSELHDRLIIVDKSTCWILGQSINNAAKSKQTYMVPITENHGQIKIDHYYELFHRANKI
jgi:hypothetical protein